MQNLTRAFGHQVMLITANTAKCEQKSLNIQENFNKKKKDSRQNKY